MQYEFQGELWVYPGEAAWHFVTVPQTISKEIQAITSAPRRGFGSVRVVARIGESEWKTSIFPDSKSKTYLLPIKKAIRMNESIGIDQRISISIRILENN